MFVIKGFLMLLFCFIVARSLETHSSIPDCPNQGPNITITHHNRTSNSTRQEKCENATMLDVQFLLYTRTNKKVATILNPYYPFKSINFTKPIIIIVHGWVSSPFYYGIQPLKDAYLDRYDCNVILLDWSKISHEDFQVSACKTPGLGKLVAHLLCTVETEVDGIISQVHIVGHSLGAHLVGFAGKFTKSICNKTVGRITGLDPGGHFFQENPSSERLDKTDAFFVDVLHTNTGFLGLGYSGNLGDIDFYLNCGEVQPGCLHINPEDEIQSILKTRGCSHFRVLDLMIESVNSDGFVGVSCKSCAVSCNPDKDEGVRVIMGENCPDNAPRGAYLVKTKKCPPYALN